MNENERRLLSDDPDFESVSMEMERDALRYDKAYTEENEVRLS